MKASRSCGELGLDATDVRRHISTVVDVGLQQRRRAEGGLLARDVARRRHLRLYIIADGRPGKSRSVYLNDFLKYIVFSYKFYATNQLSGCYLSSR